MKESLIARLQRYFRRKYRRHERKIEPLIYQWQIDYYREASKSYNKTESLNSFTQARDELYAKLETILKEALKEVYREFWRFNIEKLVKEEPTDFGFEQSYSEYYRTQVLNRAKRIEENTFFDIKKFLQDSVGQEVPRNEIVNGIIARGINRRFRAKMIARTETHNASNYAQQKRGEEEQAFLGETVYKVWLPARDERVRDAHKAMLGSQMVAIDSFFIVGGEPMKYPGDPGASAKNTVNCRCTMIRGTKRVMKILGYS